MISAFDYANIVFYFAFVVGVGFFFSRRSRDTSDYFRGSGTLPWWATGASAWMASFSAWTFTGAAGKIYETGLYVLGLYYSNIVPYIVLLIVAGYRFRRLRVVTPLEGLRLRFGSATQQFYTWIRLPVTLVFSAFGLNAVGVFMAAIFRVPVALMIVVMGALITLLSMLGGILGGVANDFVQMLLVAAVAIVVAVRALMQPGIGGLQGLIQHVPQEHFDSSRIARPEFVLFWFLALTFNTTFGRNSLLDDSAAKFMSTRSDRDARLMVMIPLVGTIIGPFLWFVPPMAAAVLHPHLSSEYSMLRYPDEAAFLATAHDVLPRGMMGLLICAIFASTLSTTYSRLNGGAGLLVRNFYLPVIEPACPEGRLLRLSRVITVALGLLVITLGVLLDRYREHGLFDMVNQIGVSLALPLVIPACLGMFYRRTPGWAGWSTVVVGFAMSAAARFLLTPEHITSFPLIGGPYSPEERTILMLVATVVMGIGGASIWFFATSWFYTRSPADYRQSVDEFFRRIETPLPRLSTGVPTKESEYSRLVGCLAISYGVFTILFVLIPNPLSGRVCYLSVGGAMAVIGAFLLRVRHRANADARAYASIKGTDPT